MFRVLTLCALVLTLDSFANAQTGEPQPILITSGALVVDEDGGAGVDLASRMRGFTLQGGGNAIVGGVFMPALCVGQCMPGDLLSLEAGWSGSDFPGTASIDGQTYDFAMLSAETGSVAVSFAGSWVAPAFKGKSGKATVRAPFTFEGSFAYPLTPEALPSELLLGHGMATLHLRQSEQLGGWIFERAEYDFRPTKPVK